MTTKESQRKALRSRLHHFDNREKASQSIQDKLFHLGEYLRSKSIFVYLSKETEVDTKLIIKKALKDKKRVFVPVSEENGKMSMTEVNVDTVYVKGIYNIEQPQNPIVTNHKADVAIVPVVGFDSEKNRLGQGKGYYDRFLIDFVGKKIAIAFSIQKVEQIVAEENDIKMDIIITEEEIF